MQHPSEFGSNIRSRGPPVDRNSVVDGMIHFRYHL